MQLAAFLGEERLADPLQLLGATLPTARRGAISNRGGERGSFGASPDFHRHF
jgi:hypothetical protein